MKKWLTILLTVALLTSLLTGCGADSGESQEEAPAGIGTTVGTSADDTGNTQGDSATGTSGSDTIGTSAATSAGTSNNKAPEDVDFSGTDEDMFTDRDEKDDYNTNKAVVIQLNGSSAKASSNSVRISGSTVTITEEATYVISGTLNDGMLVVNANDKAKPQLVFNGAHITSKTAAALYIVKADKVFVTLADGTQNSLSNGGEFVVVDDNNIDGALFSKQDLTLNGNGSLTVTSPAGHGIVCKDDLVITGGNYVVNSASHGLEANDSIRLTNATLTIDAGKDAIHSENDEDTSKGFVYISGGKIQAEAEGDGIVAGSYLQMESGTIDLLVGGGYQNGSQSHSNSFGDFMGGGGGGGRPGWRSTRAQTTTSTEGTSMKGLKAAAGVLISNGHITIDSADDAIHSDTTLVINGGTFVIASGDDAIHAEETLTITDGTIDISTSYEGLEALHIDVRGGNIKLKATDDGLNAAGGKDQSGSGGRDQMYGGPGGRPGGMSSNSNGSIKVSGGKLYINSSGDGMDANGTLEISGGHITIVGPTQGDTSTLDYDKTGVITGGTFIGTGSTMMAQSFSSSAQGVIVANTGRQAASTPVVLKDASGKTILSQVPELDFARVVLSSPDLVKGETYYLTIGTQTTEIRAS